MKSSQADKLRVSEEAALWLHRLEREDSAATRADFSCWVKQGARNLEEFLLAQAVWRELDHAAKLPREALKAALSAKNAIRLNPGLETAREDLFEREAGEAAAPDATRPHLRGQPSRLWAVAAAVAVAMVCVLWLVFRPLGHGPSYVTGIGEQQALKLEDGSVIHLNTLTRVEVQYSAHDRVVRLLNGEALFLVTRDPNRPFIVVTDSARILAVGTQFNVYRNDSTQTRVSVVEGVVEVGTVSGGASPSKLAAGEEAEIDRRRIVKAAAPNIQKSIAWRARRLVFPSQTVAEIAAEFNRYSPLQITVQGESLRARRMSGVFDADDPSPFLEFLAEDPAVEVTRSAKEVVIRAKKAGASSSSR